MNNPNEEETTAAQPAELAGSDRPPRRPSDLLLGLQLEDSLSTSHLGIDLQRKVAGGCTDLYNRFKVKDAAESLQVSMIVALHSAVLGAYREAAWRKDREQILVRAFEGTSKLVKLIDAFEARRDRKRREEPELREQFLQSITDRLGKEV